MTCVAVHRYGGAIFRYRPDRFSLSVDPRLGSIQSAPPDDHAIDRSLVLIRVARPALLPQVAFDLRSAATDSFGWLACFDSRDRCKVAVESRKSNDGDEIYLASQGASLGRLDHIRREF